VDALVDPAGGAGTDAPTDIVDPAGSFSSRRSVTLLRERPTPTARADVEISAAGANAAV